jgi:hypothetical protein
MSDPRTGIPHIWSYGDKLITNPYNKVLWYSVLASDMVWIDKEDRKVTIDMIVADIQKVYAHYFGKEMGWGSGTEERPNPDHTLLVACLLNYSNICSKESGRCDECGEYWIEKCKCNQLCKECNK